MIQEQITTLTLPYPLGDKRVRVYVPAHEEGETFPVVYMTDGQNLFEDTDLRFGCWYTREAVAEERSRSGQAAIIVGIHNDESPRQRANELTPKSIGTVMLPPDMPEEERVHVNPSGEVFDDFVVNTVMPAVEAQFPVRKGRNETAFCGSSSGGLQSYFTALSHPDKFCAAGVFSPALMFYSPEDMRSWIASVMRDNMPYLYFYMGGGDELEQILAIGMDRTYDILMELYPPEKLSSVILPDQKHHESAWAPMEGFFAATGYDYGSFSKSIGIWNLSEGSETSMVSSISRNMISKCAVSYTSFIALFLLYDK